MSSNGWKEYTVQKLVELEMLDKPLDGNHGAIHPKSSDYVDFGVPFIMANDLKNGKIDYNTCSYITEEQAKTLKKGFAKSGDILLTHKATIGRTAIVDNSFPYIILTPQVTYYRVMKGIYNRYLKYYFDNKEFQKILNNWAGSGSTRSYLGITGQLKLPIKLPTLIEQKAIAATLSCLDDKIELNNRINKNLEEMAQAIFNSWFVDFEPFQDGEFEDSELGRIPKGWRVGTLDEVTARFATGLNPRKNFVLGQGDNFYVTIKNMGDNQICLDDRCDKVTDEALVKINKRSDLIKGDLLFSGIGTIGRVFLLDETPKNWNISESVFTMRPNRLLSSEILYMLLLCDDMQGYSHLLASGSVQKGIRMVDLKKYKLLIPNKEVVERVSEILKALITQIKSNQYQNKKIKMIRDSLLPKLMSGEIRVPLEEA